ncbi:unnamed protein product [Polarella glacialis]|uniref:Sensory neuron membrane protein 2 n=1 Tax=Polarella glacialis TaxID=89957 RepID=A0A813JVV1_POLGL|nr:unnamed protein product [Polarella glacialis]
MALCCGQRKLVVVGGLCGIGLILVSIALFVAGGFYFLQQKNLYIQNAEDLLYIDGTLETSFEGPLGTAVAEQTQFSKWAWNSKERFDDCVQTAGRSAETCSRGAYQVQVVVFNVTNPLEVVLGTAKPKVQEIGPLYLYSMKSRINVDVNLWNAEKVARFQLSETFEIDAERCEDGCKALLDMEIVVPNIGWGGLMEVPGGQQVALYSFACIGIQQTFADKTKWPALGSILFGLDAGSESQAFASAFLVTDVAQVQASVLKFMQSLKAAQAEAAKGNSDAKCLMGTYLLNVTKCTNMEGTFKGFIPTVLSTLRTLYGSAYGVGDAMPIFIKKKVRDVIGFGPGAGFSDPILGNATFASYLAAQDSVDRFQELWMGSDQGLKGLGTVKKYQDAAYDCRIDADCKLSDPDKYDSCTADATCTPQEYYGYCQNHFPGQLWGDALGSEAASVGSSVPVFFSGQSVPMKVVSDNTLRVRASDGSEKELRYRKALFDYLPRRLESCNSTGAPGSGTPGIDCDGPPHTTKVGATRRVPLYGSLALFDHTGIDEAALGARGQVKAPYNAEDRVDIIRCKGTPWCDDPDKYSLYVKFEPELGFWFDAALPLQLAFRVGQTPSLLYPNMQDSLIPVLISIIRNSASEPALEQIQMLQGVPSRIDGAQTILLGVIIAGIVLGCIICIGTLYVKFAKSPEAEPRTISIGTERGELAGNTIDCAVVLDKESDSAENEKVVIVI